MTHSDSGNRVEFTPEVFEGVETAVRFRMDERTLILTLPEAKTALYDLAAACGCQVSDAPGRGGSVDWGSMNRPRPVGEGDE